VREKEDRGNRNRGEPAAKKLKTTPDVPSPSAEEVAWKWNTDPDATTARNQLREKCLLTLISFFDLDVTADRWAKGMMMGGDLDENTIPPLPLVIRSSKEYPGKEDRVMFVRKLEREIFMAAEDEAAFTALVADDNALLMKVVASSAKPLLCYAQGVHRLAVPLPKK